MEGKNKFEFEEKKYINNENKKSLESNENINNNEDKKPFFLMTLEDSMGKCQQIKIFQNSNPSELAYYFCKENNLDFASMKYIKSNIKSIVKKFNEPQQKTLLYNDSNNAIKEEEDEDDYLTEGTVRSNEKQKIQDNEEENYLNNNYKDINKSETNNNSNNDNENNDKNDKNDKNDNNDNNDKNDIINNKNKVKNKNNKFFDNKKFDYSRNDLKSQIIDTFNKKDKAIKLGDKWNKMLENINSHIKSINKISKIPLKINYISPKQIEINENILKIINNNKNENILIDNESTNNIHFENINEINKSNYNNTTDRSRNSAYISVIDKEITDSIKSREKTKVSDKKENNINYSPKYINNNNKNESNKEIKNNNYDNNNFNFFGDKYINLNKKSFENEYQNQKKNEISKSVDKSSESIEYGVPVLNSGNYNDKENNNNNIEYFNNELNLEKNETNKVNKNDNNINDDHTNKINKKIIFNKMKKLEVDIPKKNIKRNKEINKLLHLIKNSCYNTNKNIRNKIIKEKQCNSNTYSIDRLKAKENNSLDINNEISRNIENNSNNIYSKELFNNVPTNENKYKNNNYINTNFNAYIVNNKFNYKKNNNNNNSKNELNQNNTNPINRKYFFSNPNLSSNQEAINLSNALYNIKNNLKNFKKNELPIKSKSLGKEKNRKKSSISKNKIKLFKNDNEKINNKIKEKEFIKEKKKKCFLKFKNNYNINNNSSTQNNAEDKSNKCLNLKTCQTPPTKKGSNTYHHINSLFSEWIMSTINKDSRNIFTSREHYFNKNNEISKTSKSVSELGDNIRKNSNFRMILSKSNFKNSKPNLMMNNKKYTNKNNLSKEINNKNNKHHYINSLKIINKTNTLYNKNNTNKNFNNNTNNNDKKIINRKNNGRNNIMNKKTLEKLKYINSINKNPNLDTINDYNFNNNNFYLRKFINNTIHSFIYNSSENSKSEDKFKKIIQKQLTSPSKNKYFELKAKKKIREKRIGHKNAINKIDKILLNNSSPNENNIKNKNTNDIHINNLININNYQKNKNYNLKFIGNGNNHFIKNSRLKKNKIENKLSANINKNENNKRLINFSNELKKYYLNTEVNKNNFNNMTYSNFINNNISLSNYELSADEKINDEILVNIFNQLFIFLNREKTETIILLDSFYKNIISLIPQNIRKLLQKMIEILCKNFGKKKKNNLSNNSLLTNTKSINENQFKINKNNFINEMIYIYKYYLNSQNKKLLMSYKDLFYKINQENIYDRNFAVSQKNNNNNDFASPKSYQKKSQYKTKTEFKNNVK